MTSLERNLLLLSAALFIFAADGENVTASPTNSPTVSPTPASSAYQSDAWGAILAVAASCVSIVGINTQKFSHTREDAKPEGERRRYVTRKLWWAGMLGVIGGAVIDFLALGLANPALVTALGGATALAGNAAVAKFWQKEPLTKYDVAGIAAVICGAVVLALNSTAPELTDLDGLLALFKSVYFISYCGVLAFVLFCSLCAVVGSSANGFVRRALLRLINPVLLRIKATEMALDLRLTDVEERMFEMESRMKGIKDGTLGPDEIKQLRDLQDFHKTEIERSVEMVREEAQKENNSPYDAYIYAACSGVVGALSVLIGSFVSKMVVLLFHDPEDELKHSYFYLMLLALILTTVIQTAFLNKGLQLGDAMAVYPFFQAFWIGFGTIGSTVLYQQAHSFTGKQWGLYVAAMLFMLIGVYFLWKHASARAKKTKKRWGVLRKNVFGGTLREKLMEASLDENPGNFIDAVRASKSPPAEDASTSIQAEDESV